MGKYRMVQEIGPYLNHRWEIQEKYMYYKWEHGELKKVIDWHMVFWSSNKERCEEVFQKYLTNLPQKYKDSDLEFC